MSSQKAAWRAGSSPGRTARSAISPSPAASSIRPRPWPTISLPVPRPDRFRQTPPTGIKAGRDPRWRSVGLPDRRRESGSAVCCRPPAVAERLQEGDDRMFLAGRQAEMAYLRGVDVLRDLGRRPRGGGVARVIEVHDRPEALEVAVVPVGLDEARGGPLGDVAQRRHLELAELRLVDGGIVVAGALEVATEAVVDPGRAQWVVRELAVEGVQRVPGDAQVVVAEVGEPGRHVAVGAVRLPHE